MSDDKYDYQSPECVKSTVVPDSVKPYGSVVGNSTGCVTFTHFDKLALPGYDQSYPLCTRYECTEGQVKLTLFPPGVPQGCAFSCEKVT